MVLVDTVPIDAAVRYEYSAYYASRFACELLEHNPDADIYFFHTWVPLQTVDGVASEALTRPDWQAALANEQAGYEALADQVSEGVVIEPGVAGRLLRWVRPATTCSLQRPVLSIPVAGVFARLSAMLPVDGWTLEGRPLEIVDLFANPRRREPTGEVALRVPVLPHDDIHASDFGVTIVSAVHYAVLYRQDPRGALSHTGLSEPAARGIERLIWSLLGEDPRTGVGVVAHH